MVPAVPAADEPVEVGAADEGGGPVVATAVVSDEVASDDVVSDDVVSDEDSPLLQPATMAPEMTRALIVARPRRLRMPGCTMAREATNCR